MDLEETYNMLRKINSLILIRIRCKFLIFYNKLLSWEQNKYVNIK
jgi:hypothetical protein